MGWIILVVLLLVLAYVLYLGNRARQQQESACRGAREAEKLEAKVYDHRAMSADHQAKADELKAEAEQLEERADREMTKAARHEVTADEIVAGRRRPRPRAAS